MPFTFNILRPVIHLLPPETVHNLGIFALKSGLLPVCRLPQNPALCVQLFGLNFSNPVGLAAGFDKNAVAVDALLQQGFGFVEAGTVTPLAQSGNPKPRVFRLSEDTAVINRLGFNNGGLENYVKRFSARDKTLGIAGANIGRNKNATDAVADYVTGLKAVYAHADYITVNISSPNTQGLRALQEREALTELLCALTEARINAAACVGKQVPLLLKIAPDLETGEMEDVADVVLSNGIDGLIISNTTISRPATLSSTYAKETGGLSGTPLFDFSTLQLKKFYQITEGRIPLVGVGGVSTAQQAYAKIRAGASLVQLYSGLVYHGFGLVGDIRHGLATLLTRDGYTHIQQAIGADA